MKKLLQVSDHLSLFFSPLMVIVFGLVMMSVGFYSCADELDEDRDVEGMRPVYASAIGEIKLTDARSINETGKIVYLSPYIFISEKNQGIHVVDNSDPENPIFKAFIEIPFTLDFAIKNDILFAQSGSDLVSLRLSDESVTELNRKKNVVTTHAQRSPGDGYSGYFECADPNRGYVLRWEIAQLHNPKCFK